MLGGKARAGLCRLGGADPAPAFDGQQAEAGGDLEDGRANPAPPADHRRECRPALGGPPWRAGRLLDRPHAGLQAADAGARGLGEQDGSHRLGLDGQGWDLPGSARAHRARLWGCWGVGRSKERDGATVTETGSAQPALRQALQARGPDLDLIRELVWGFFCQSLLLRFLASIWFGLRATGLRATAGRTWWD